MELKTKNHAFLALIWNAKLIIFGLYCLFFLYAAKSFYGMLVEEAESFIINSTNNSL
jgi:hypothetical protein